MNMESSVSKETMMNFDLLEEKVRSKAKDYLDVTSEENLSSLVNFAKFVAGSVFQNYYFAVENSYLDGEKQIEDEALRNEFADFHDGYRARMKEWVNDKENEIRTRTKTMSFSAPSPKRVNDKRIWIPFIIVGIGTFLAIVSAFFTRLWIPVIIELLVLAVAFCFHRTIKKQAEADYLIQKKKYEEQIGLDIKLWVDDLVSDLKEWLNNAKSYSDSVLKSFGLNTNE